MMRTLISRLLRYGVTGGIAAVVDAGGFAILVWAGMGIAVGGTASFCVAALVNYWLTSRYVFNQSKTASRFALFFAVALMGLTVNMSITLTGVLWLDLAPLIAKILGIGTAFLINFALNAGIVFRQRR